MKLYNTLTRSIELFKPIHGSQVSMYTCGLTVYSHPHIGNWVAYIYWDILQRILTHHGYDVKRIQNITDVGHLTSDDDAGEDKMQVRAAKEGKTAWDIADTYSSIALNESQELGLITPTLIRATSCIDKQIEFVNQLEDKGYTYIIKDEGVYFDTSKLPDYGKLAQLDIDGLDAGARVSVDGKRNPTDFALWKFSPKNAKRDMEWESPWGVGFPGWHLECSAIAHESLGEHIDIHTGGIDHIPVHHTNEIAQSEALYGPNLAKYWVHANHIKVNGTKMSKSLGNVYTLEDIKEKGYSVVAFKLLILSKHYRTEGNFSWEILESSQNRLQNWQAQRDKVWQIDQDTEHQQALQRIKESLYDDLDTPKALAAIDEYFDAAEKRQKAPNIEVFNTIETLLGIKLIDIDAPDEIKKLLEMRSIARDSKNWEESDNIRQQLHELGYGVSDGPHGQIWSRIKA